jgi:hypothetical protein
MKRLILLLTIIWAYPLTPPVNAQVHTLEHLGFDTKVVTLSKGKYQEFHDLKTVVEIGSVLFNTESKEIIGFVLEDTLVENHLKPHIVSRWISPDPLAEEYSSWSPYNYTMNNPILFIDPNGMYVDKYYDEDGNELGDDKKGYNVRIVKKDDWNELTDNGKSIEADKLQNSSKTKLLEKSVKDGDLSVEAISNVLTHLTSDLTMPDLFNNKITVWGISSEGSKGIKFNSKTPMYDVRGMSATLSQLSKKDGVEIIYILQNIKKLSNEKVSGEISWGSNYNNIRSILHVHEYLGRYINNKDGASLYKYQLEQNKVLGIKVTSDYYQHLLKRAGR